MGFKICFCVCSNKSKQKVMFYKKKLVNHYIDQFQCVYTDYSYFTDTVKLILFKA